MLFQSNYFAAVQVSVQMLLRLNKHKADRILFQR